VPRTLASGPAPRSYSQHWPIRAPFWRQRRRPVASRRGPPHQDGAEIRIQNDPPRPSLARYVTTTIALEKRCLYELWRTQLGPCGCCHGVRTRRLPARPVRVDERASRRGCTSCVRSACLPGVVRCKRGAHRQRRVAAAHRARRNSRWTSKLPLDRSPFQGIGRARKPWTTGGAFTAVFGSVVMTAISVPAALRGVPGVS
jgi:hypothetical protein